MGLAEVSKFHETEGRVKFGHFSQTHSSQENKLNDKYCVYYSIYLRLQLLQTRHFVAKPENKLTKSDSKSCACLAKKFLARALSSFYRLSHAPLDVDGAVPMRRFASKARAKDRNVQLLLRVTGRRAMVIFTSGNTPKVI